MIDLGKIYIPSAKLVYRSHGLNHLLQRFVLVDIEALDFSLVGLPI